MSKLATLNSEEQRAVQLTARPHWPFSRGQSGQIIAPYGRRMCRITKTHPVNKAALAQSYGDIP